jgi:lipoprotein-releasing system permease protein
LAKLADKLLLSIDDVVQVTTAKAELFQLKVVGIFQSGILEFDNAQKLSQYSNASKDNGQTQ